MFAGTFPEINEQNLNDTIGADAADPVRDLAYVYDQTTQHILAVDTNAGTTSAVGDTSANVAGLAVSIDDTRLFASEPGAFQIEVFNLPGLTLLKTLNVGVAVQQIVPAANDRVIGDTGQITGFNADTGATLYSMSGDYDGLLRTNPSGTALYSRARGLSGNDGSIRVWNISGTGSPVSETAIPGPTGANSSDFAVDPINNHAYFGDGGADGVEVTQLSSGNQTVWTSQNGAVQGIATLPGSAYVYATTFTGYITRFDQNGVETPLGAVIPGAVAETLVITPNGNLLATVATGVITIGFATDITQTPVAQSAITTLTASTAIAAVGSGGITFTVGVSPEQAGGVTPTGDVHLYVSNGQPGQDAPLTNGACQFAIDPPIGGYVVYATYNGDGTYGSSISENIEVEITATVSGSDPSTIALTSVAPTSTTFGTPVTFDGAVTSTAGTGATPTGIVTFNNGATLLGTTAVQTDGTFGFVTTALPVGSDTITASYGGDNTYASSVDSSATVTVAAASVTPVSANDSITALTSVTPNPAAVGTMVIFRGSVASAVGAATVPTGLVTLFDGDASLGNAALLGDGTFSFTTSSLNAGAHTLTARYLGDSVYTASASAAVSEVVASGIVPAFGAATVPASVVAGATFTSKLPLTISNQSSDVKGKFTINLYADATPSLNDTQTLLSTVTKSFLLKGGKSKPFALKLKSVPATLAQGTYYLLAQVVDPTGASTITALPGTVQVAAPFVALSTTVGAVTPGTLVVGKTASVLVAITNTGNTLASASLTVTVGPSTGGVTLGTSTHGMKIKPGKSVKVKVHFKFDGTLAAGTYFPQAVVTLGTVTTTTIGDTSFTV